MSEELKRYEIAVDLEYLAKCLGFDSWDIDPRTELERAGLRVVTDAHRASDPSEALTNIMAWMNSTYNKGLQAGRRAERADWEDRIKKLFEMR